MRITEKIRLLLTPLPKLFLVYTFAANLKYYGIKATYIKVKKYFLIKQQAKNAYYGFNISKARIKEQKLKKNIKDVKFSIIVPVNNNDIFFKKMIESVLNQTYNNWELCLSCIGDNCFNLISGLIKDKRIKIIIPSDIKLESEALNQAVNIATGNYFVTLKSDDLLHPSALYEAAKEICTRNTDFIYSDEAVFSVTPNNVISLLFKPDFAPDTLRSFNYISNMLIFSKSLQEKTGFFNIEMEYAHYYDFIFRLVENTNNISHISKVIYYRRNSADLLQPKIIEAEKRAIGEHLERIGCKGIIFDSAIKGTYRIQYDIMDEPLVSIIIPTKDQRSSLEKCISSIVDSSTYKNFEIIIIENNSCEKETFHYYDSIKNEKIRIIKWENEFNFPQIINFAVQHSKGDYCLYMNNDTEVITPSWIEQMLMYAQRPEIGAVGAKLYYPDNTIQHAGGVFGILDCCSHVYVGYNKNEAGYMNRLQIAQNISWITGACMMVKKSLHEKLEGWDVRYKIRFNDVDFCIKLLSEGYLNIFTPYAELYHYDSKSIGPENTPGKKKRRKAETRLFYERWEKYINKGDPYYNSNIWYFKKN
jgi:GT2 family glycosyltransferase